MSKLQSVIKLLNNNDNNDISCYNAVNENIIFVLNHLSYHNQT